MPSLVITIGALHKATSVGVIVAGVILVVTLPIGVALRGPGPKGTCPRSRASGWRMCRKP